VSFEVPQLERFAVNYRDFPSRGAFLRRALLPFSRHALPEAPSLGAVLMRSLLANRNDFERHLQDSDLLMVPPVPAGMGVLDWGRHSELMERAYEWGLGEIAGARGRGHAAVTKLPVGAPIVPVRGRSSGREQM